MADELNEANIAGRDFAPTDDEVADFRSTAPTGDTPPTEPTDERPYEETPAAPDAAAAPESESPAPTPEPDTSADTPQPKKYAGKYDSVEEMERALLEKERELTFQSEARSRAERLVESLATGRGNGDAKPATVADRSTPPTDEEIEAAGRKALELINRAVLGEEVTPREFADAIATVTVRHPMAGQSIAEAIATGTTYTKAREELRSSFFEKHPKLRGVREDFLRNVVLETGLELSKAPENQHLTKSQFNEKVLEETAKRAKQIFNIHDDEPPAPPANGNGAPRPKEAPRGVRSEGPGMRSAPPPPLEGQAKEIAEIF